MSERIRIDMNDPVTVQRLSEFLRNEIMARANRASIVATFPEVFDRFTPEEIEGMDAERMEKLVNHFLLHGDGTNQPKGVHTETK